MPLSLNQLGQITLTVDNVDVAETFYLGVLGLRKLYRFGDLLFFDCAGVRLLIEKSNSSSFKPESSILYFRVADIHFAVQNMIAKNVNFVDTPHLVTPMEDHDLWMVFFKDPSGNLLALMQEAPKGYKLPDS